MGKVSVLFLDGIANVSARSSALQGWENSFLPRAIWKFITSLVGHIKSST